MQVALAEEAGSQRLLYVVSKATPEIDSLTLMHKIQLIRKIVESGANINYVSEDDGMTCIGHAIVNGNLPVLKVLSSMGACLNQEIQGQHPLIYTCFRRPEFVIPLAKLGAGQNLSNPDKKSVLHQVEMNLENEHEIQALAETLFPGVEHEEQHLHELVLYDFTAVKNEFTAERSESRRHYLKQLIEQGPYRPFSRTPHESCLDSLYETFPNFTQVLDYLKREVSLANLSPHAVFSFNPILLHGEPGMGKTRFIRELCKVMGLECNIINCGSVTAGWVISGSSTSWQDGRPGMVHTSLMNGGTGNPLMMLDEIDKLAGDTRHDGFGPLYQLLERSTASKFKDEAVCVEMDCSRAIWIATANDISVIPEPIKSRLRLIEVTAPTKEEMPLVIKSIIRDILEEAHDSWGQFFSEEIDLDLMNFLSQQSPREIGILLREAMGAAAIRYRSADGGLEKLENNKKITLNQTDFYHLQPRKQRAGFC